MKSRLLVVSLPLAVVALFVAAIVFYGENIAALAEKISPGCLFRKLTRLKCPGCGGTRAFVALTRGGSVEEALRHNFWWAPSAFILIEEYVYFCFARFQTRHDSLPAGVKKIRMALIYAYAAGTVAFMILRNIFDF